MPGRGGKNGKKRKNGARSDCQTSHKPLVLAEDQGQTYGIITKTLGDCHFMIICQDGATRRCKVRGKMKNRQIVKDGDVVLVCTRDFEDGTGDIIDLYSNDQVKTLRKTKELIITVDGEGEAKNGDDDVVYLEDDEFDFSSI